MKEGKEVMNEFMILLQNIFKTEIILIQKRKITWYVPSKVSYINLVINEVFPTKKVNFN